MINKTRLLIFRHWGWKHFYRGPRWLKNMLGWKGPKFSIDLGAQDGDDTAIVEYWVVGDEIYITNIKTRKSK